MRNFFYGVLLILWVFFSSQEPILESGYTDNYYSVDALCSSPFHTQAILVMYCLLLTARRELNVHVSQDASSCSSLTSKEGRNNKLLKDSDEPALSDGYHRKEKFPGSRRNLLKEHYKGINSPNKAK